MPDVVFSNRGALMKPSRASEVLPQFQFPSFELAFSDKTVEAMLAKDKEWARVHRQIGEATLKLYETYKTPSKKAWSSSTRVARARTRRSGKSVSSCSSPC